MSGARGWTDDGDAYPVTSAEHMAVLEAFNAAADDTPKSELRRLASEAVLAVREVSGEWAVHAQSYDIPGPGRLVSVHPSEAEALTECRALNERYPSDFGSHTIRPVGAALRKGADR